MWGFGVLGGASLAENFDGLLPDLFRQQVQQQQDPSMQELVRDLLTNQSFRRDLYVKGRDPLWPREALSALEGLQLLRLADEEALAEEGAFQFSLGFGEVLGRRDWFQTLMKNFADEPLTLAELRSRQTDSPLPELLQNLCLLITRDWLALVPPERDPEPARRFNARVAERIAAGAPYRSLACPRSGNIRSFSDIDLLAFHALQRGCPESALTEALDENLRSLERQCMREGQALQGEERHRALETMTEAFRRRILPLLHRLGVL